MKLKFTKRINLSVTDIKEFLKTICEATDFTVDNFTLHSDNYNDLMDSSSEEMKQKDCYNLLLQLPNGGNLEIGRRFLIVNIEEYKEF